MKTLVELEDEIKKLAEQGRQAALARNIPRCLELSKQIDPLLRELAQRTGDQSWADFADKGIEIHNRALERQERRSTWH